VSALIETAGLSVTFGGITAVDTVSLSVPAGQMVGLIGPNGAGKSSLLAAIGGQVRPGSGSVRFRGRDISRLPPHRRARLGVVRTFQQTSVFERLTVFENLLVAGLAGQGSSLARSLAGGRAYRREAGAAAGHAWQVLAEFELAEMADAYGHELSGGQRRLVELMRCLMQRPAVLLLDEPMVGVATHLADQIKRECARLAGSGLAIILVEHALEVVEELCDRVVVMAQGRIIADGSYQETTQDGLVQEAYFT
jgi:ABC-type branched-subunit amino acid transport system ATPase component